MWKKLHFFIGWHLMHALKAMVLMFHRYLVRFFLYYCLFVEKLSSLTRRNVSEVQWFGLCDFRLLTTVIFLNYLLVNFPKVTSQIKKLLLVALKTLHILLHVKELSTLISLPCKTLDLKPMTLWRGTTLTCLLPPREFW